MIKEKIPWVTKQLIERPGTRDSNELLYYLFLQELGYDVLKPVKEFLKDMNEGKIPYIDTIGRVSRKIQEENPHLRGLYWGKRQKKEVKIRKEIRKI
jgi:hypothetical protein